MFFIKRGQIRGQEKHIIILDVDIKGFKTLITSCRPQSSRV